MAMNNDQVILQCSKCENELDLESKTLPCLHSLCRQCLDKEFQGEISGIGLCPECQEILKIDELTLSPFLISSLKGQLMDSSEWKCDICLEGNKSIATIWCKDCVKLFCEKCNQFHKRLPREKHNSVKLDDNGKKEVKKALQTDLCNIHKKGEELYCDRCNVCLCDTCYYTHLKQSPQCPFRPIQVREEALKKRISEGPTLLEKIEDLKNNLQERNRKSQMYSEELETECQLKCKEIWQNYEDMLQELRDKMIKMCEELRFLKDEQVKKWQELVEENERLLKKLEIWRLNLHHLLKKYEKEKELVCGVELIGAKLASLSPHTHQIITEPVRKYELELKFSNYWLQFLEGLKNQVIASGSLHYSNNLIQFETEWNLPGSNHERFIPSILVSQRDKHIFLADSQNSLIIELTESGKLISENILIHQGKKFNPGEMFFSSSEILGVNCWREDEEKLFFLERQICSPLLKIGKIIDKKVNFPDSFSVCQIEKTILICNEEKFQIDFYSKKGEYIKTIDTRESVAGGGWPLIRADLSTGNFWGTISNTSKMSCFNENGQKIETFKTKENISNFSINGLGHFYFCNLEGIFSFLPEKNVYKFQKKSENCPRMFVSSEKIFVCLQIDKKYLIKIFKILS